MLNEEKLDAIMLLEKAEKYYPLVLDYFRKIGKEDMLSILKKYEGKTGFAYLTKAAIFSKFLNIEEMLDHLANINYPEEICVSLITNNMLSGEEIITLIEIRGKSNKNALGYICEQAIDSAILSGPQLMQLLHLPDFQGDQRYVDRAAAQLETFIDSE